MKNEDISDAHKNLPNRGWVVEDENNEAEMPWDTSVLSKTVSNQPQARKGAARTALILGIISPALSILSCLPVLILNNEFNSQLAAMDDCPQIAFCAASNVTDYLVDQLAIWYLVRDIVCTVSALIGIVAIIFGIIALRRRQCKSISIIGIILAGGDIVFAGIPAAQLLTYTIIMSIICSGTQC